MNLDQKLTSTHDRLADLMAERGSLILKSESGADVSTDLSENARQIQAARTAIDDLMLAQEALDRKAQEAAERDAQRARAACDKEQRALLKELRDASKKTDTAITELAAHVERLMAVAFELQTAARRSGNRRLKEAAMLPVVNLNRALGSAMPRNSGVGESRESDVERVSLAALLADADQMIGAEQ